MRSRTSSDSVFISKCPDPVQFRSSSPHLLTCCSPSSMTTLSGIQKPNCLFTTQFSLSVFSRLLVWPPANQVVCHCRFCVSILAALPVSPPQDAAMASPAVPPWLPWALVIRRHATLYSLLSLRIVTLFLALWHHISKAWVIMGITPIMYRQYTITELMHDILDDSYMEHGHRQHFYIIRTASWKFVCNEHIYSI